MRTPDPPPLDPVGLQQFLSVRVPKFLPFYGNPLKAYGLDGHPLQAGPCFWGCPPECPDAWLSQWMPISLTFIKRQMRKTTLRSVIRHSYKRLTVRSLAHSEQIYCEDMITTIFFPAFFVDCEIIIDLIWDWIFLAWDWWSEKWTLGDWLLVCAPTRIYKPNYWMQLVNSTERSLTRQMDPDFMIWYQQSVRQKIMTDM
jgi:hypothetical protein